MSLELSACSTVDALLLVCAQLYTRETFLYRRVNTFLREAAPLDSETGRNLGVYIALLRDCFCVRSDLSPVSWEQPRRVYRGARFAVEDVIDYARRPQELIRWQGFASSSSDLKVALSFPGNVLFEIWLSSPVASLHAVSAFAGEEECVLSPYQWFFLRDVRWDSDCQRWIIAVDEEQQARPPSSWLR
jgi:hypothetical protein